MDDMVESHHQAAAAAGSNAQQRRPPLLPMPDTDRRRQRSRPPGFLLDQLPDLEFELVELPPARKRACIPASSKAIQDLLHEVTASGGGGDDECAICLQGFYVEEKLRAMPCSHAFHQHCIFEWLRRKTVCPLCRHQPMPTAETDEERRRISTMVTTTRGVSAYHSDDDEAYIASLGDDVTIVQEIEMDVQGDMERIRTAWAAVERLTSERATRRQT